MVHRRPRTPGGIKVERAFRSAMDDVGDAVADVHETLADSPSATLN